MVNLLRQEAMHVATYLVAISHFPGVAGRVLGAECWVQSVGTQCWVQSTRYTVLGAECWV